MVYLIKVVKNKGNMMNKKRKFLMPLAALASVLVASNASASETTELTSLATTSISSQNDVVANNSNDVFKFILKAPIKGMMVADDDSGGFHYSHSSHSSHASHSSHQSGY